MNLVDKYPEVRNQFVADRNKGINVNNLGIGSTQKIWWKCNKGEDHQWFVSPNQRTSGGKLRGCPICAGKIVVTSNSLKTIYPSIADEWDYSKNNGLKPSGITPFSNKKVWWACNKNKYHQWRASPKQRTRLNNSCPKCNSIIVKFPEIAKEFHSTLNENHIVSDLSYSSHIKIWWKCPKGFDHVWKTSPNSRISMKTGCPICAGYKVVKSNSVTAIYPELAAQWDFEKNKNLTPDMVYAKSSKKVWWQCDEGDDHNWNAQIKSRANGIGCPICSGRITAKSNSLAINYPQVAELFHQSKNGNITALDVTPFSSTMIWWKCPKGDDHIWKSTVANVVNGSTCPVCMGRKITESNNLAILYPELLKEWDYDKNSLDPNMLSPGRREKVWWICARDNEHTWYSTIKDRTAKKSGCPICSIKLNVSETKMLEFIKEVLKKYEIRYRYKPKWLKRMELDVYVPKLKLGFEYQGIQHFQPVDFFGGIQTFISQVKRDQLKRKICFEKGITLIEVYYNEVLTKELITEKINTAGKKLM